MSAYDMTFSDAIYGPTDRYVSRVRLGTMLDHEYDLLVERLDTKLGAEKAFFVFADTVATVEQRLTYFYGRRRDDSDPFFQGWRVSSVLPMRALWITIGYFYLLRRAQ